MVYTKRIFYIQWTFLNVIMNLVLVVSETLLGVISKPALNLYMGSEKVIKWHTFRAKKY